MFPRYDFGFVFEGVCFQICFQIFWFTEVGLVRREVGTARGEVGPAGSDVGLVRREVGTARDRRGVMWDW